ncbi:MAG: hypothetical protein MZW92_56110 [Comamonadaceae bacterium]|nr:hypothetical protein [Comamonadaceae bacterium]
MPLSPSSVPCWPALLALVAGSQPARRPSRRRVHRPAVRPARPTVGENQLQELAVRRRAVQRQRNPAGVKFEIVGVRQQGLSPQESLNALQAGHRPGHPLRRRRATALGAAAGASSTP